MRAKWKTCDFPVPVLKRPTPEEMRERWGKDFLYVDHAYFQRGDSTFRLIRGDIHLTHIIDRPRDRLKRRWNVQMRDWRRNGSRVIVIPPSEWIDKLFKQPRWLEQRLSALRRNTDRPIYVKSNKLEPLEPLLEDAWAVVTFCSTAGLQAALAGVPVFAGPQCVCYPVSAGSVSKIEAPELKDREPWLAGLAYATWSIDEIDRINWDDYNYDARRNDLS